MHLSIAGFIVKIVFLPTAYPSEEQELKKKIRHFFNGFITENVDVKAHFIVEVCDIPRSFDTQNVNYKKHYTLFYESVSSKKCRTFYSISIYQFQLMIQNIIHQLLNKSNGFLLHSSASLIGSKAVLFIGKSGAGKSTSVQLLKVKFAPLADDMSIVRKIGKTYYFFQHPFRETSTILGKKSRPINLGGVFLLVKKPYFSIKEVRLERKIQLIIQQLISPTKKMAGNALEFANSYPSIYQLHFAKEGKQLIKILGET